MDLHRIRFERSFGISSQLPASDLPEIVFTGRSNVGKSSLINKLFNRKGLARTSQTPGKTSTINFFCTDEARFVDLPGYGFAQVAQSEKDRWSELINGYFTQERRFCLVLALVDIRHAASKLDEGMLYFLQETELPYALVLTKADKLSKQQQMKQKAALMKQLNIGRYVPVIACCSANGTGIDTLRSLMSERIAQS